MTDLSLYKLNQIGITAPSFLNSNSTPNAQNAATAKTTTNESELVELDFDNNDEKILRKDFTKAALPRELQSADPKIVFDHLVEGKNNFILKSKLYALSQSEIDSLIAKSNPKTDSNDNNNQVGSGNGDGQVGGGNGVGNGGNQVGGGSKADNNKDKNVNGADNANTTGADTAKSVSKGGIYAPNGRSGVVYENWTENDTVESLTQKKNEVNGEADTQINAKQAEKNELINSKLSDALKAEHQNLTTSIAAANSELAGIRANISSCESRIHTADCNISRIQNELSSLSTNADSNSDNEAIKASREARRSQLNSDLSAAQKEKEAATNELNAEKEKESLKQNELNELESRLGEIEREILQADSELAQQVSQIENDINDIKQQKDQDIRAIDARITELKSKEKNNAEFKGTVDGETTEVARRALEIASSAEHIKSFTDNKKEKDWCVRFATEAYNKALKEFGIDSELPIWSKNLKKFAADNGALREIRSGEDRTPIAQNLRPGDILQHNNHVYMVMEVYSDGSYRTLEGNIRSKDSGLGAYAGSRLTAPSDPRPNAAYNMTDLIGRLLR